MRSAVSTSQASAAHGKQPTGIQYKNVPSGLTASTDFSAHRPLWPVRGGCPLFIGFAYAFGARLRMAL